MNYLIVENNTITNIIVADSEFATAIGALPFYDGAEIGGTYAPPPDYDKLRSDALSRIDGKCSAAIYSGVTVGDKHYKLTPTAQGNLKTALDKVASGAISVIYAADNEEPTLHTAAQITAINNVAYEWGVVNTTYYGKLQKWIERETDITILNSIDYGMQLPNDLMQELNDLLQSVGINISNYADKLINA